MRKLLSTLSLLLACALLGGCAGAETLTAPARFAGFPAVAGLPRDTAAIGGYALLGRENSAAIPVSHFAALGDQGEFTPGGTLLPDCAYAGYCFNLLGAAETLELQLEWAAAPAIDPDSPLLWIGLANWDTGRWQWFAPASATALALSDTAPYIHPSSHNLYAIVLVAGTAQAVLNELGFPAAAPPDTGPRVELVAPLGGAPGAQITMQPKFFSLQPFDIAWDFGGGAEPNTSTEAYPKITLGVAGQYNCNISVSNSDGTDSFDFKMYVDDELYFACGRLGTNNWPLENVTVQISGTVETTVLSDHNGFYAFTDLPNGDCTVTPLNRDCVPGQIDFTIDGNFRTDLDFHAWDGQPGHSIVGPVVYPMGGEMMTCDVQLTGPVERFSTVGVTFADLPDGDYRVTPCEAGLSFWPPYRDITLSGYDIHGVTFMAYLDPITTFDISGTVTLAGSGLPAAGVRFLIDGMGQEFAVTDAAGYYEAKGLNNMPWGGQWAVKIFVPEIAATFTPKYGYLIQDETQTTGKDFVMTVVQ